MSFTSKGSALVILLQYDSTAVEDDIPDYFVLASDEEINERTGAQWEADSVDQTLLVDSTGGASITSPIVPIISLTSVKLIKDDESKTNLAVSGSNREIRFNAETGQIQRISGGLSRVIQRGEDNLDEGSRFPEGVANIELIGKFGKAGPINLLRLLANMIILRQMTKKDPTKFRTADITSEKIGKYAYTIGGVGTDKTSTLQGFIDYLFSILPKDDIVSVLDV